METSEFKQALARIGGQRELAKQLGITAAAISQWRRVPVTRVNDVERILGIPRERLRPDIFGRPEGNAA
jgi:DNA-binding transcriptional regulator YdaS (Cro superfamily)